MPVHEVPAGHTSWLPSPEPRPDAAPEECAGILFRAPGPRYLLLHRTDRDEWEGPGGHLEPGETPEEAAKRETEEETGFASDAHPWLYERSEGHTPYSMFIQDVEKPFRPRLNYEHHLHGWYGPDELPESTHPQIKRAVGEMELGKLDQPAHRSDAKLPTETEVMDQLRRGELESPVRYGPLWLFRMRVTGTGIAYRPQHKEWVYRPPRHWLTKEALRRVDGLPILAGHADKGPVAGDQYHGRNIGVLVHPWIEGDDVWGIAKIYDDRDAALIVEKLPSTSPSVTFTEDEPGETVKLSNGEHLFIEGNPKYIDHLAAVPEGVWDKYDGPSGISLDSLDRADAHNSTGASPPYSWRR